jgi:hypothetical protein
MKALALAVAVTAGTLLTAGTADAQFRLRRGGSYSYSYPSYSYSYPSYSYPGYSYAAPSYYSGDVVTSNYVPTYTDSSGVVVTSGYTPTYTSPVYSSGYSYPSTWSSPYYGNSYYNGGYYNSGYYNGSPGYYNGMNVTPSGVNWGGRSIWRW